jgi:phage tail-like protein
MAGGTENATWPLPRFYFSVTGLAGGPARFQEVSGLDTETAPIEYRHGEGNSAYPIKLPGPRKTGDATLRKGIFVNDTALWNWLGQVSTNTVARTTIVVTLLDETGAPKMVWTLNNAYPTKITGSDLKSDGNEVAVESVEIAYETLVVSAP